MNVTSEFATVDYTYITIQKFSNAFFSFVTLWGVKEKKKRRTIHLLAILSDFFQHPSIPAEYLVIDVKTSATSASIV